MYWTSIVATAFATFCLGRADYITIDSYAGPDCTEGHGLIEIDGDTCHSGGSSGLNVVSFKFSSYQGPSTMVLDGYADGSACIGDRVFDYQVSADTNACYSGFSPAGSLYVGV